MKGRKPLPSTRKAAEGNRSKLGRRRVKSDPQGLGTPSVPKGLGKDAAGLHAHVLGSLPADILSKADDGVLEVYARAWARYRDAHAKLDRIGPLVQSERGPVRNPLLLVVAQAERTMLRAAEQLGLSPVSRARLAVTAPARPDDTARILLGDDLGAAGWSIPSSATN